ncbi:MAG: hypothetical protein V3T86_03655 [Planctomycetota bacterium]
MIHYFTSKDGRVTIDRLQRFLPESAARRIQVLPYESLGTRGYLPYGAFIFASVEVQSPPFRDVLVRVAEKIRETCPEVPLLNDPAHVMARYQLNRVLFERGINDYDVYRLDEVRAPTRYPVFLRREDDHCGNVTGLLNNEDEYRRAVAAVGVARSDTLAVEFVDTRDETGAYRKYGAYILDGVIEPAHLFSSEEWMVKGAQHRDESDLKLEQEFLRARPHLDELGEIARLAGIQWGRVDYALLDGRIQIFEINTNPVVISEKVAERVTPELMQTRMALFARTIESLDDRVGAGARIPIAQVQGCRPPGWRRIWNRAFSR